MPIAQYGLRWRCREFFPADIHTFLGGVLFEMAMVLVAGYSFGRGFIAFLEDRG